MKAKTHTITLLGVSTAAAMVLAYVETLIPVPFAVPGVKIGLANTVAVFLLVKRGWKAALPVSIVRVLLSSLMFGNFASFAYSVSGALLSMLAMIAAMKTGKLSEIGVSVIGGVFHNAGQIIMAIALTGTKEIAFWLPPLIISGIVTGIAVGTVAVLLVKKIDLKQ